jgi:hypothetical protein
MILEILRLKQSPLDDPQQTEGVLYLRDNDGILLFECATLELPWKDNQNSISCIPDGKYKARYRQAAESPSRDYDHIHILDVPDRSYILVHSGNYNWHVKGCVLVGKKHADINGDGLLDVTSSKDTMKKLMKSIPKHEQIDIVVRWR